MAVGFYGMCGHRVFEKVIMTAGDAKQKMNLHGPKAVVCGAGGFIGGHLVKDLLDFEKSWMGALYPASQWT
jgi:hypothetical protein